jgi:hypothetical protein
MWVFDGEEWTKDDGSIEPKGTPVTPRPRYDELSPELQVIEIVPVVRRNTDVPPFPMP